MGWRPPCPAVPAGPDLGWRWHPHGPLSSCPWNPGALLPGAQGATSGKHTLEVSGRHLGEISFDLTPNNNFSAFLIASSCAGPPAGSRSPASLHTPCLRWETPGPWSLTLWFREQLHGRPFLHGPGMGMVLGQFRLTAFTVPFTSVVMTSAPSQIIRY